MTLYDDINDDDSYIIQSCQPVELMQLSLVSLIILIVLCLIWKPQTSHAVPKDPPKKKKLGCPPPQREPIIFGGTHPYHVCKAGFPRAMNIDRGAQNPWELRCKIVCGEMFQAVHHYTSVQGWALENPAAFFGRSPIGHLTIWIHGLIAIDIADWGRKITETFKLDTCLETSWNHQPRYWSQQFEPWISVCFPFLRRPCQTCCSPCLATSFLEREGSFEVVNTPSIA